MQATGADLVTASVTWEVARGLEMAANGEEGVGKLKRKQKLGSGRPGRSFVFFLFLSPHFFFKCPLFLL